MQIRSLLCNVLIFSTILTYSPQAAALTDISHWAVSGVAAAQQANLIPDTLSAKSATGNITRAEFCDIALRLYQTMGGDMNTEPVSNPFADTNSNAICTAYHLGLVNGRNQTTFDPDGQITRQELCKMLNNVVSSANLQEPEINLKNLPSYADSNQVETWAQDSVNLMLACGIINGVSTRTEDPTGEMQTIITLSPTNQTTREQALLASLRFTETFDPSTVEEPTIDSTEPSPEIETIPNDTISDPEGNTTVAPTTVVPSITLPDYLPNTDEEKMAYVFGPNGTFFTDEACAKASMTEIEIPVWRLQNDGSKTAGTAYIEVNASLAATYKAIFEEIYNGSEQFPIHDVGGYAWRASEYSEHRQGTAIDINYDSNMECTIDENGNVIAITCGSSWNPDTDPYAIKENSDVYNAFTNHGFSWGGNAWRTKRDYMHFSYFGH